MILIVLVFLRIFVSINALTKTCGLLVTPVANSFMCSTWYNEAVIAIQRGYF